MRKRKYGSSILYASAVMVMLAVLTGCGGNMFESLSDKDTAEAKMEQALIDLDKGDYDKAVTSLKELLASDPENTDIKKSLASAYMGSAGLDAIALIRTAAELEDNPDGDTGGYTTFSRLLPDPDDVQNAKDLHEAVRLLAEVKQTQSGSEDDETSLLLAVAAASDIIVTVGSNFGITYNQDTGKPDSVPTTEEVLNDTDDASGSGQLTLTTITQDLVYVIEGVEGSGLVADVAGEESEKEIVTDMNDITSEIDTDGDNIVSASELVTFLESL